MEERTRLSGRGDVVGVVTWILSASVIIDGLTGAVSDDAISVGKRLVASELFLLSKEVTDCGHVIAFDCLNDHRTCAFDFQNDLHVCLAVASWHRHLCSYDSSLVHPDPSRPRHTAAAARSVYPEPNRFPDRASGSFCFQFGVV